MPIFGDRALPGFERIRAALDAGALGRPLYLRIDREMQTAAETGHPGLPKVDLEDALLHDADLLRSLGGDYSRVTAGLSGAVDDRVAAAAITLSGEGLPEATWIVRGTTSPSRFNLVVAGERGEIAVSAASDPPAWSVRTERVALPEFEERSGRTTARPPWTRSSDCWPVERREIGPPFKRRPTYASRIPIARTRPPGRIWSVRSKWSTRPASQFDAGGPSICTRKQHPNAISSNHR